MLTAEMLREMLHYDPLTGHFTRKGRRAGYANGNGYRRITIQGASYYEHRLAWLYQYGVWPSEDIDHRDTVKDHNWILNLRDLSRGDNNLAKKRPQSNNRSGYLGVSWSSSMNLWAAEIKVDKVRQRLGYFPTPEEASTAYQAAKNNTHKQKGML